MRAGERAEESAEGQRIRVLWVHKALGWGGAEVLLLEAAAKHDLSRFELHVAAHWVAHRDYAIDLESRGVVIHELGDDNTSVLVAALRLLKLIRSLRPDLVHMHSPLLGSFARIAACFVRPRPQLVTTEHNNWSAYRRLTRVANAVTCHFDHRIFSVSRQALESIKGPARKRASVLIHGIDVQSIGRRYATDIQRRSEVADHAARPLQFINVGNLRDQKDQRSLLLALAEVRDAGLAFRCLVLGSGPLEDDLRSLTDELGLRNHVQFMGTRSDALKLMSESDIFVMSSAWEGWPLVIMEALALGLPIVSTAVGGVAEELSDSEACILCAPGRPDLLADAMLQVAASPELRAQMSRQAVVEAKRFDSRRFVQVIEECYLGALDRSPVT